METEALSYVATSRTAQTKQGEEQGQLVLPTSLREQLYEYRRLLWRTKVFEASAVGVVAFGSGWVSTWLFDRWLEPPWFIRITAFLLVMMGLGAVPFVLYRWVLSYRSNEQLARLIRKKLPTVGDSLLGVIELQKSQAEQNRSPALCRAAMKQVAEDVSKRDLGTALPVSRHRFWGALAAGLAITIAVAFLFFPSATANALARSLQPFGGPDRFTFTRVEVLPENWYVPLGEPISKSLTLNESSLWEPKSAWLQVGSQQAIRAQLLENQYSFVIPPQIEPYDVRLRIGDVVQRVALIPTLRPEVSELEAKITLPGYLQRSQPIAKDARGGTLTVVKGSQIEFDVKTTRELISASLNGHLTKVDADRFTTGSMVIDEPLNEFTLQWQDKLGLSGRQPLQLNVLGIDDELPSLICDGLPRQEVILDSELLKFTLRVTDDYGIKRAGILWRGVPSSLVANPASGERVLIAGASDKDTLEASGAFSAASLGITPQPIELYVWAEDFHPEHGRVMSAPYMLYVLNPDQHAIWMTEQLSKWHRQALDVRDQEMQLFEINKELRKIVDSGEDSQEVRERIERQSQAERANSRRLERLSEMGDQLLQRAARNSEIGVGHLENWAEMLQVLKDISANRMPTVATLLKEASEAPKVAAKSSEPQAPGVGQIRDLRSGKPDESEGESKPDSKAPVIPTIADVESSQNPLDLIEESEESEKKEKKPSDSALRLPVTTVAGPTKSKPESEPVNKEETPLEKAVEEQEDLLAEFEKIADELNAVLANLEGSTLVKRLKSASRKQTSIAQRISGQLSETFGRPSARIEAGPTTVLKEMATEEDNAVMEVSYIMDDMSALFDRRQTARLKTVLDEMKSAEVIDALRQLSSDIAAEQGLSVAQCEFWSDTLDRWAEDLIDPARSGQCPGGKSPASLPPSVVLEAMQILESEINLREETRIAEQARSASELTEVMTEGLRLSETQAKLRDRVYALGERILELPEAEEQFAKELELLAQVDIVMGDAAKLLAVPDTGPETIAAETDAIELLLQSKRINPKAGGGSGGTAPGGGGGGKTVDSALALLGSGINAREVREETKATQSTGSTGSSLPEEFRSGLDEYFNRIEERIGGSSP